MVTGVDLIAEQIRAAQGEVLRYKQEDIQLKVRQQGTPSALLTQDVEARSWPNLLACEHDTALIRNP